MEEYYNSDGDCASRIMIQDQSYDFHIHQVKFVRERLTPIVTRRGRRSDKTGDGENKQLRAVWGSVNWVQRVTRPDVSALASLRMGSLNRSTVQDVCDANAAVERLKAKPYFGITLPFKTLLGLKLSRITVKKLFWLVQLRWSSGTMLKSHCLKRKCPSTLAAETHIMSAALAEVECFNIVERAPKSRNRGSWCGCTVVR